MDTSTVELISAVCPSTGGSMSGQCHISLVDCRIRNAAILNTSQNTPALFEKVLKQIQAALQMTKKTSNSQAVDHGRSLSHATPVMIPASCRCSLANAKVHASICYIPRNS